MPDRRHRRVRDAVADLLGQSVTREFRAHELTAALLDLIGADMVSVVDVSVRQDAGARLGFAPADLDLPLARIPFDPHALMAMHPAHRYFPATLSMEPVRVSDVTGAMRWRRSRARNLLHHYVGVSYQLMLPIAVSDRRYCVANLYRGARDFGDQECDSAGRVQPILVGLHMIATPVHPRRESSQRHEPTPRLTPREMEVLHALSQGLTAVATAHRLGISAHTVGRHTEAIHIKLGTHDRATTIVRACQLGLLTI